jgi:hypothetical protein
LNGPHWLHEIKYDGYRLRLERDGDRVRPITRGGHNWTDRYPWIVEAALIAGAVLTAEERELEECSLSSNHYQFSLVLGSSETV